MCLEFGKSGIGGVHESRMFRLLYFFGHVLLQAVSSERKNIF